MREIDALIASCRAGEQTTDAKTIAEERDAALILCDMSAVYAVGANGQLLGADYMDTGTIRQVTLLEAYYGSGVVLDYSTAPGRDAAFRLALLMIASMERFADPHSCRFAVFSNQSDQANDERGVPFDRALDRLQQFVTPRNRYVPTVLRVGLTQYRFGALAEGSGFEVGPDWPAPNEWYDRFWDALWQASQSLESALPGFRLLTPGGQARCAFGHLMSPFRSTCELCGATSG